MSPPSLPTKSASQAQTQQQLPEPVESFTTPQETWAGVDGSLGEAGAGMATVLPAVGTTKGLSWGSNPAPAPCNPADPESWEKVVRRAEEHPPRLDAATEDEP